MGRAGDGDEIDELSARVVAEAPEAGTNPLLTEAPEVEADGKVRFSRARRFAELPISRRTLAGLAKGKWEKMTDVQRATIAHALAGRDVLGAARTGSGKTLAFLVPLLELLWRNRWGPLDRLGGLVISPTRELALQIFDVLRTLGHKHELSAGLVIGGKDQQEEALRIAPMNILIATPGRLLHHIDQTAGFELNNLQILVLDEADRLLDLGFKQTILAIVQELPKKRQTLLFSATQTRRVSDLLSLSLREPQYISVHADSALATPARLEQHYMLIPLEEKLDVLWGFVRTHLQAKTLVFFSSCKQVAFVHAAFSALRPGVPVLCLHGRQKQMKRLAVYTEFCAKKHAVLFATDVAARGLDFPTVQWVVQADVPEDVPTYIHRTGRTARHTSHGRALLLLSESERAFLGMLASARITLQRLRPNKQKLHALAPKLRALLSQRSDIKYTAQRAVVSYVRSVRLQANKEVFDAAALPLQAFAESYGLAAAPRVRNLSATGGKGKGRNWEGGGGESSDESADDGKDEDGAACTVDQLLGASSTAARGGVNGPSLVEEGGESSGEEGDGEEGFVVRPKQKKRGPRNKLLRLLDRNTAERRIGSAAAESKLGVPASSAPAHDGGATATVARGGACAADDLFTVKRRIAPTDPDAALSLPERVAKDARPAPAPKKIKIRKGGTVAGSKRTVFDEEGRPLEERLEGAFSAVIEEKGDASLTPQNPEVRAAAVREALRSADTADRERERARIRERHRLQKQKRKAAEAQAAGLDAHGRLKEMNGPAVLARAESDDGSDASGDRTGSGPAEQKVRKKAKRSSTAARGSSTDDCRIDTDERRAEELLARLLPA